MQKRETITLSGEPFTKPLPRPAEELVELFVKKGFKFENIGDETLILNEVHSKDRFSKFEKLISENGLVLKIYHSIWTEYEDDDFEKNPLWILLSPDILIDGINFEKVCKVCKKSTVTVDSHKKVSHVKSKKPILSVNGQFKIVRKKLKDKMEQYLSGTRFEAFDDNGEYFYLSSKSSLGELVNTPDDFVGYNGICPECNLPVYKMFFGPLTYAKSNWNRDDIVSGGFHQGVFFTEKAYQLIKSVEKEVSRDSVIILK